MWFQKKKHRLSLNAIGTNQSYRIRNRKTNNSKQYDNKYFIMFILRYNIIIMVLLLLITNKHILTSSRSLLVTDMHGDKSWCQFPGTGMRFFNVKTTQRLLLLQKDDFTFHSRRCVETDGTLTHFTGSSATESWTEWNRNWRNRNESVS